jgi:hypothetical protein
LLPPPGADRFPDTLKSFTSSSSSSDSASSSTATKCWPLICTGPEPHFNLKTTGGVISKPPRETVGCTDIFRVANVTLIGLRQGILKTDMLCEYIGFSPSFKLFQTGTQPYF